MIRPKEFRKTIRRFYRAHRRDFAWRTTHDPYRILVSEIMLQQTQVEAVAKKYPAFTKKFKNFNALARAPLREVLKIWQGLGYNRRALYLRRLAKIVQEKYGGKLPHDEKLLYTLPGIGQGTAGAIRAFAFNAPSVFIETNIRRVFLHFFFPQRTDIHDKELFPLIEKTLDRRNPREWYYTLMDYGAMLAKQSRINPNRRSAHYHRQNTFKGSNRELRGKIIKTLIAASPLSIKKLAISLGEPPQRVKKILAELKKENFIIRGNRGFRITPR